MFKKKRGKNRDGVFIKFFFFFLEIYIFWKKKIIIGEKCQINLLELTNWLFS